MSDQVSPPADDVEGREPDDDEGQEPDADKDKGQEPEAKTFGEEYVSDLRKQAAAARSRATKAEREAEQLRDGKVTETERLTRATKDAEARADKAELKAQTYEVAADRSLDLKWASRLTGETREELEASADELVKLLAAQGNSKTSSFDGGVRKAAQETGTPEEEHNLLLLRAAGRPQA